MWQSRVPATMMQKTLTSRKTGRLGVSVRHDQETVPQRSIDAGGAGSCSVKWVGGTAARWLSEWAAKPGPGWDLHDGGT